MSVQRTGAVGGVFCLRVLLASVLFTIALAESSYAQVDPRVRDQIIPASVQLAVMTEVTENGVSDSLYIPVGSGTIVSSDGLILTNWHVVNMQEHQSELDTWETQARATGESLSFALDTKTLLVLASDDARPPTPRFFSVLASHDEQLDLAVLSIVGDLTRVIYRQDLNLPYVPLGDSDLLGLGDPIDVFSYPMAAGGSLAYTTGVVSGFNYGDDLVDRMWINTDATISGGSSGGTAVNQAGQLIGIPTQGTELDCRPGDTNRDGVIDARDVGCIPVGGSIGQLRPVNIANDLLLRAGFQEEGEVQLTAEEENFFAEAYGIPTPAPSALPQESNAFAEAYGISAEPGGAVLPHIIGGRGISGALGYFDPATYAPACAVSPMYDVGDQVVVKQQAGVMTVAGDPVGWLLVADVVEIVGPHVESGACDHWPVRVVDSNYVQAAYGDGVYEGSSGLISEIAFQPEAP